MFAYIFSYSSMGLDQAYPGIHVAPAHMCREPRLEGTEWWILLSFRRRLPVKNTKHHPPLPL